MSQTAVSDQIRSIFATFDAKDVSTLAGFMTDDVRLRLGNAEMIQGKTLEVLGIEVRVDLLLVHPRNLEFSGSDQARDQFLPRVAMRHDLSLQWHVCPSAWTRLRYHTSED